MKEVLIATDKECMEIRQKLIDKGYLLPTSGSVESSRNKLIESGNIKPMTKNGKQTFCKLVRERNLPKCKDEGEYSSRPIESTKEYERRLAAYFYSIQEILYARDSLKLVLGKKNKNDPDWVF